MKVYQTYNYDVKINELEATQETEKTFTIDGHRRNKESSHDCYFKTREEAKGYLIKVIEGKLVASNRQAQRYKEELQKAESL